MLSELTASALRDYGYAVTPAGTAQAAVKLFESGEYDIVLLDLGLPDACGTEVALNIRTQKSGIGVPIIAVTGQLSSEMRSKCSAVGFNSYITKPYALEDLARHIESATGIAR